jgi:hypothetical protein
MKYFMFRLIDALFIFSLGGLFVSLLLLSQSGSFGPCGPSDDIGAFGMIGGLVSLFGIVVGLILSLVRSFIPPRHKDEHFSDNK